MKPETIAKIQSLSGHQIYEKVEGWLREGRINSAQAARIYQVWQKRQARLEQQVQEVLG